MTSVQKLIGESDVVLGCHCEKMIFCFFVQRNKPRTLVPGGGLAGRNKAHLLRIGLYRLGWLFQRVKESSSVLPFQILR